MFASRDNGNGRRLASGAMTTPETGEHQRSTRLRAALLFAAAIAAGAAAGLLVGLALGDRLAGADPVTPPAVGWPAAYRCGVSVQPEDLDRVDCDAVSTR